MRGLSPGARPRPLHHSSQGRSGRAGAAHEVNGLFKRFRRHFKSDVFCIMTEVLSVLKDSAMKQTYFLSNKTSQII